MNRKKSPSTSPTRAKKRLRWLLAAFLLALSLPIYLLLNKVYTQLEAEAYFQRRTRAETLFDQVKQNLQKSIDEEEIRPIAEYSFFNILENPLLLSTAVKFSPLSTMPPKSGVPGLIGYFQINPDNTFHTPVLPELNAKEQAGLSPAELKIRLALRNRLRKLLSIDISDKTGTLNTEKTLPANDDLEQKTQIAKKDNRLDKIFHDAEKKDKDAGISSRQRNKEADIDSTKPVRSMKATLSDEKLQELNIDSGRWKKNQIEAYGQNLSISPYQSRKEKVKLPEQSQAATLFNRARQPSAVSAADHTPLAEESSSQRFQSEAEMSVQQSVNIDIESFESEVTPLQMLILANNHYLCFYRQVWKENGRYIQGFIVHTDDFLATAVQDIFDKKKTSPLSSLLFAYQGKLIQQFRSLKDKREFLIYRSSFSSPFQYLEMIINSSAIAAAPGSLVIDFLAITLGLIIIAGLLLFYRLASGQIDLAEQQRKFISAVSHELKTPLTSIRMYGEMLRTGWVTDESKKKTYYDYIFFESERLSRLIDNVLQLARLENHSNKNTQVSVDPLSLLQNINSKISAQIESSDFQLNIIPPKTKRNNIHIHIDEDAFYQIIINLVDNAVKFSSDADTKIIDIGMKFSNRDRELIYFVRDYGPGIDRKLQKKIFRLFYRAGDELTRTKSGTGIGLALIIQLAEKMNAKIDLINRQPGVEFQIRFKCIS